MRKNLAIVQPVEIREDAFVANMITHPAHYLEGRVIEPIEVIEAWDLSHHLACVVKYIARAGRKNPIVEDLSKAEWYLERAIAIERDKEPEEFETKKMFLFPKMVVKDWNLSFDLGIILTMIYGFKAFQSFEMLKGALQCLRSEIFRLKGKMCKVNRY
jgi:hypothetical protein